MSYRLGVDLGTSFTTAAIERPGSAAGGSLGVDSAVVPSLVYIGSSGERLYGSAAAERAGAEPHRVLRGFVRRIGDDTPMLPEVGPITAAHKIAADFVAWVVAQASVQEGRAPSAVAVTHPATWGPHKRDTLRRALLSAGVPGATLVAEPVAAATAGAVGRAHNPGAIVAVYDLGGRTFDAALVRREASGAWTLLGRPAGLPDLGGADLDDLVLSHVVGGLSTEHQQAFQALDSDHAEVAAAVTALRAACVRAKETLSTQTSAAIEVDLPGIRGSVRLTRAEFEAMISPSIEATVDVLDSVIEGAGLVPGDLDHVLISGGSSRIPLVTQLLSRQFHLAVVNAGGQQPGTAVAAGAALTLPSSPSSAPALPMPPVPAKAALKAAPKQVRKVLGRTPVVPAPAKPVNPVSGPVGPVGPATAKAEVPAPAKPGDAAPASPAARSDAPAQQPGATKAAGAIPAEAKRAEAKAAEAKAADTKPVDAKPVDAKPVDAKPVDAKPADAKPAAPVAKATSAKAPDAEAGDAKAGDAKAGDTKTNDVKVNDAKSATPRKAGTIKAAVFKPAGLKPVAAAGEPAGTPVESEPAATPVAARIEASSESPSESSAPIGMPIVDSRTSKPIRSRRVSRRSEIVGLEGLSAGRADAPAEGPAVESPRAVIPARAVASVDALLTEEPARVARADEMLPPPRPAMEDTAFAYAEDVVELEERGWSARSMFSIRRSFALTALTAAIYVGATAWIPATPAITDQSSNSTQHVASAKHAEH
jgi:actin-like ATPase involved in cell morphogenesis